MAHLAGMEEVAPWQTCTLWRGVSRNEGAARKHSTTDDEDSNEEEEEAPPAEEALEGGAVEEALEGGAVARWWCRTQGCSRGLAVKHSSNFKASSGNRPGDVDNSMAHRAAA